MLKYKICPVVESILKIFLHFQLLGLKANNALKFRSQVLVTFTRELCFGLPSSSYIFFDYEPV
jgi:hypothetical protein